MLFKILFVKETMRMNSEYSTSRGATGVTTIDYNDRAPSDSRVFRSTETLGSKAGSVLKRTQSDYVSLSDTNFKGKSD